NVSGNLMNVQLKKIIDIISRYSNENPEQRFAQILFNLGINEFSKIDNENFQLRDIYNDKDDQLLERISEKLDWYELQKKIANNIEAYKNEISSMTVNERLYVTNIVQDFEKDKNERPEYSRFILERLKVDANSIDKIMS